jgi:DNA-binding transcriptional MerR regulator
MLIGEVAPALRLQRQDLALLRGHRRARPPTWGPSGYRGYDEHVLDRLRFIRSAQAVGLSLGEIRGIALADDGQPRCGHVLALLRTRANEVERTAAQLRTLGRELTRLVERAAHLDPKDCDTDARLSSHRPRTMTGSTTGVTPDQGAGGRRSPSAKSRIIGTPRAHGNDPFLDSAAARRPDR